MLPLLQTILLLSTQTTGITGLLLLFVHNNEINNII